MDYDCVVAVDIQSGFINEHTEHILPRVERAVSGGLPVIATRFVNMLPSYRTELKYYGCTSAEDLVLFPPVSDNAAVVLDKGTYSSGGKLVSEMRRAGLRRPLVMGLETDACVLATVIELFDAGMIPLLDVNGCATPSGHHDNAVEIMRQMIGSKNIV